MIILVDGSSKQLTDAFCGQVVDHMEDSIAALGTHNIMVIDDTKPFRSHFNFSPSSMADITHGWRFLFDVLHNHLVEDNGFCLIVNRTFISAYIEALMKEFPAVDPNTRHVVDSLLEITSNLQHLCVYCVDSSADEFGETPYDLLHNDVISGRGLNTRLFDVTEPEHTMRTILAELLSIKNSAERSW